MRIHIQDEESYLHVIYIEIVYFNINHICKYPQLVSKFLFLISVPVS